MKKILLVFIAALMLFAIGCGDSNNDNPEATEAPFKATTYDVGGVLVGYDQEEMKGLKIAFLTENTVELIRYDETINMTVEGIIEEFEIPAEKINFTGNHTFTRIAYTIGTYTKDGDNYDITYTGKMALSFKIEGDEPDKVKTVILDAIKESSESTYSMYKDAFESRYEIDAGSDDFKAEMKASLVDGKILCTELKEYDYGKLTFHAQFNNGIVCKDTTYLDDKVQSVTEYNSNGQETLEIRYNEEGSEVSKTTYEYDADNNLIRLQSYEYGKLVEKYEYDAEGNCTLEEHYDENGNIIPDEEPEDEE